MIVIIILWMMTNDDKQYHTNVITYVSYSTVLYHVSIDSWNTINVYSMDSLQYDMMMTT